ncbi:MAG: transposase [Halobacteriota archaeon]|nr:transposase [Halobacteriota archaeon]
MRTANQLTFTTYEVSQKIRWDDPIKVIFDNINWSFIHPLVDNKYSPQGADGYDPISLFKAQLLIYLGEVSSDRKLATALRYDARLCLLCDFNFLKTPSNGTFSNFRARLGEDIFYEILHHLIAQAIVLKVIHGGDTATDSTHIWAYSNKFGKKTCQCKGKCQCPREHSDHDANWGHKSKDYAFFGYKVHLIVDAKSQLPIDVIVTPGNESDSPYARPLLKGAKEHHPKLKLDSNSMDAGYDAYENYRFAIEDMGVAPIIALNSRNGPDALALGDLSLSPDGTYTCLAGFKVVYWGKDSKRGRLKFRCPAALGKCQCLFQPMCSSSSYGRTFYLHPKREYRLIGTIHRGTELWREKYDARTSVERSYSEDKGSHRLANPRVRGIRKIKIHVYLSLCAQVVKRIGAVMTQRLTKPKLHRLPCSSEA